MIFEKIQQIISEHFEMNPNDIKPDTSLADDLCMDSLDMVDVVMSIEDEFSIEVEDEDFEEMKTVDDLVKYVEDRT